MLDGIMVKQQDKKQFCSHEMGFSKQEMKISWKILGGFRKNSSKISEFFMGGSKLSIMIQYGSNEEIFPNPERSEIA